MYMNYDGYTMLYCLELYIKNIGLGHQGKNNNTYRVTLLWHDEAET